MNSPLRQLTAKRRFTEEEIKLILEKYNERLTLSEIGKLLDTSPSTIKRFLISQGVEMRSRKEVGTIFSDEQKEEIVSLYVNDRLSFQSIADKYGTSAAPIRNAILELAKDKIRPTSIKGQGAGSRTFNEEQEQEVIRLYRDELLSFDAVAERMGTSPQPIKNVIKRLAPEIVRGTGDANKILTAGQEKEICRLYAEESLSTIKLGDMYGVSNKTIHYILVNNDIPRRRRGGWKKKNPENTFTPEQEKQICVDYSKGESINSIRMRLGTHMVAIKDILSKRGIKRRPLKVNPEDITVLSESEKHSIASEYQEGISARTLSSQYNISPQRVNRILSENGVEQRDHSETCSLWERDYSLKNVQEEVARMYESGKYLREIANHYQVSNNAVLTCLEKAGVDRREGSGVGDSVQKVLRGEERFAREEETELYVYTMNGYDGLLKVGISNDSERRAKDSYGIYGSNLLLTVLASREEAYFLEQAVLHATGEYFDPPQDLVDQNWAGWSEVRRIEEEPLLDLIDFYESQLDEIGIWDFAASYVPMTEPQKAECLSRAFSS